MVVLPIGLLVFCVSAEWRDTIDFGVQGYHGWHNLRKQVFRSDRILTSVLWDTVLSLDFEFRFQKGTPICFEKTYIFH